MRSEETSWTNCGPFVRRSRSLSGIRVAWHSRHEPSSRLPSVSRILSFQPFRARRHQAEKDCVSLVDGLIPIEIHSHRGLETKNNA